MGEKGIMKPLIASQMAIVPALQMKWDHGTVNSIINGYYWLSERRIPRGVNKLLHKSGIPKGELGQCTSDQVVRGSWVTSQYDPRPMIRGS